MITRIPDPRKEEIFNKPENGTFVLQLGEHSYTFTNKTNIPFNWIDQAILGLSNIMPFNLYGISEDNNKIFCVVSLYNCHITREPVGFIPENKEYDSFPRDMHYVHMWNFCNALHDGIASHLDAWVEWILSCEDYQPEVQLGTEAKQFFFKKLLLEKLENLSLWIETSYDNFPSEIYNYDTEYEEDDEEIEDFLEVLEIPD